MKSLTSVVMYTKTMARLDCLLVAGMRFSIKFKCKLISVKCKKKVSVQ